ncbi:MAG: hypothetical protein A2406_00685 [Candidatus Komeilibacteria bacterium RIFOXYC1_FULL_37_11]|uniref:Uncharacterized protein n=1 Tax=Candidatus Komeilibacteria bacterium RIFOXYC1_FULL_37_11 TaxID=1798555 RepID=A0A1G2BW61_9BACT|nr:MAG: hypothetical protein A2406_00685 [Candidatus Komeilibacteria bacterium RIFOXYC1_FULL_37_11]OGY95260.1 MAG: hypothetical protein A2611_00990 [Candidatus Komeilibacteria bacterium RIFOXYD1_FULL_37_29]
MAIKKITSSARALKNPDSIGLKSENNGNDSSLMEFEQFVSNKPQNSRGKSWLAITLIVVVLLLATVWLVMSRAQTMEKSGKFQAIYLENGQTYYAKVAKEDALNIYLSDVYYIQIEQQTVQPAEGAEEGAEPQVVEVPVLIKRGEELHKPQGLMQINRSKLVAIEEIGADSEILKEIDRINQPQPQQ